MWIPNDDGFKRCLINTVSNVRGFVSCMLRHSLYDMVQGKVQSIVFCEIFCFILLTLSFTAAVIVHLELRKIEIYTEFWQRKSFENCLLEDWGKAKGRVFHLDAMVACEWRADVVFSLQSRPFFYLSVPGTHWMGNCVGANAHLKFWEERCFGKGNIKTMSYAWQAYKGQLFIFWDWGWHGSQDRRVSSIGFGRRRVNCFTLRLFFCCCWN
jgi:hypothetical protein